jgi:hypothetical protein
MNETNTGGKIQKKTDSQGNSKADDPLTENSGKLR